MSKDAICINREHIPLWCFILPATTPFLHAELDHEEFVEGQAAISFLAVLLVVRKVHLGHRIGQRLHLSSTT